MLFHFWAFEANFFGVIGSAAFLPTASDPLLTQNPKKAGRAGRKKMENPPSERRQTAQIGAEMTPIWP